MVKKFFKFLIVTIVVFLITFACFMAYEYFTKNDVIDENITNSDEISNEKTSAEPIFKLENYPKVDASTATQPLVNAFIADFTGEENISEDYFDYSTTHPAYLKLIEGKVDLIVVTEPSEEELKYAEENNVELEVVPVVREGFVFYVNSDNPVSNLSLEQVQDIYTGKIKNWKEVGGSNEPIRAFQRPENSGSQTGMLSLVMKDKKMIEPIKENLASSMFDIINLVSSYDNGLNSIGYSYYYYATTMFDTIDSEVANKIKLLSIDGIAPNNETIKNEEYPIGTAYYIVVRKDEPEDSAARKLAEAMLSARGQEIAEEAGYVGVK